MSETLDIELSQAFKKLQIKVDDTSKQIAVIDAEIESLKRTIFHTDFARQEIGFLPPETKAYKSVGRMYLLTDLLQIKGNLDTKISELTQRASELEASKLLLEKSLKESKESIDEMLQFQDEARAT